MSTIITRDSSLAFFVNQLDNFDAKIHEPLASVTWSRDIKLRSGLSFADQSSSFIRGALGSVGTQSATGKSWINSGVRGAMPAVSVDGSLVTTPINLWGKEVSYTSIELERSQRAGGNLDDRQVSALQLMYNMDIDEMVYIGDTGTGLKGLCNSTEVSASSVVAGSATTTPWPTKTADEILFDVNDALKAAWAASAYAVCPDVLLVPPTQYALIVGKKAGTDGAGGSILKYIEDNSMSLMINGRALSVRPCKYLAGLGYGPSDRMVAYNSSEQYVRYPLVPLRRETPYYSGITFSAPYVAGLGAVEFLYPETAIYRDGI